jgi:16S rRNA (guanine527-N7)-methyltransferase
VSDKEQTFSWRLPEWFKQLSQETIDRLFMFNEELVSFNGRVNLVSPKSEGEADLVHFSDAILGAEIVMSRLPEGVTEVYDFGSGNGFPALVLGVLAPTIQVRCVDSDARKCEFIKHVIYRLGLSNVSVINDRVENLPESSVRAATTRGFASLGKTLISARKCVAFGGIIFNFKSSAWPIEAAELPSQVLAYWDVGQVHNYSLPEGDMTFSIVEALRKKA